jgi:hypothetical protein
MWPTSAPTRSRPVTAASRTETCSTRPQRCQPMRAPTSSRPSMVGDTSPKFLKHGPACAAEEPHTMLAGARDAKPRDHVTLTVHATTELGGVAADGPEPMTIARVEARAVDVRREDKVRVRRGLQRLQLCTRRHLVRRRFGARSPRKERSARVGAGVLGRGSSLGTARLVGGGRATEQGERAKERGALCEREDVVTCMLIQLHELKARSPAHPPWARWLSRSVGHGPRPPRRLYSTRTVPRTDDERDTARSETRQRKIACRTSP